MNRSFLALFVLVLGFGSAAAVMIWAGFELHILAGFAAFCLICAGAARGLDSLLADERPAATEEYAAPEGANPTVRMPRFR